LFCVMFIHSDTLGRFLLLPSREPLVFRAART
jgi:hypothetical protein